MKISLMSLFLLVFASCSYAQDLSKLSYAELDSLMYIEYDNGTYGKAIPYMQAAREKAKIEFGEQDSIFTEYTNNLGFFYKQIGLYQEAELLYLQAIMIDKKSLGMEHPNYAVDLKNLADLYQSVGRYTKAEPLLLEAIKIEEKALGIQHPHYANSLNNLAYLYQSMGHYTKAEPLYLQSMAIRKKALGIQHPDYANSLNNLASLYQSMGSYTQAEPLLLETNAIIEKALGIQHPDYANSLNNLASLYHDMGNYTKAELLYLQTMAILKKALLTEHPDYAISLNNLANLFDDKGDYIKAEPLYLQATTIWKKILGSLDPDYAKSLNNLAGLYKDMGKLDTAFYYCRLGIFALAPAMDSSFTNWDNLDTFSYSSNNQINKSIRTLLSILQKQYAQTKNQNKLETHYAISQAAIRLNERFRNEFTSEEEKLRVLAENNEFVLTAIKTAIKLGKPDYEATTFGFAEMNKGVLLLEAAKTADAQQFGELPDMLVQQEKNLQKQQSSVIAKLSEKRLELEKDSLRRVLNGINQEIDVFTKMLKNKYPKYAALKYGNKTASAKEIQALLDDKTALLEYMIGDSVVYLFYVDKKQMKLMPIYLSNKVLNERIKILYSTLSDYRLATKESVVSYQKYTENAFWFYENLVAPAFHTSKLEAGKGGVSDKLRIVSDGELGHLPFEAFLVEKAPQKQIDYYELHYLSNDYKISYNYSATLWNAAKKAPKNTNNGQILAMASNYSIKTSTSLTSTSSVDSSTKIDWRLPYEQELRFSLMELPAAQKEIETLAQDFNGFFAFDKDASEKNFKTKAADYAVIHLAMHGLLDFKEPILSCLAFTEDGDSLENNFLHAYEISKMKLNTDLVVLSACETGYGRFEKGNGIASLAQAFAYAGAPALIVSLWQVNDYATSEIMKILYQNLADGMEKDEALQQAKMKYMKEAKGVMAHPAFWSPFILMGNTDAIYLKTKGGYFWWVIGVAILALGSITLILSNRKKNN